MSMSSRAAAAVLFAVGIVGCVGGSSPSSSSSSRGSPGSTFTVQVRGETAYFDPSTSTTIFLPSGGRVTAAGDIDCGIVGGVASTRCSADYPWGGAPPTMVALTATPDGAAGFGYFAYAGACSGSGPCTVRGNSDVLVLVRFARTQEGLGGHPNLSDPEVHGQAYRDFVGAVAGALQCTTCHGANLQGRGLAVACTRCHASPTEMVVGESVATTGGTVELPNGPALALGAGALTDATTLTVGETEFTPPLPPDAQPVSSVYAFGPSGLVFEEPVTVTFPVPPGTPNATVFWTTPDGTAFEDIGGVIVGDTIQAQTTHLSKGFVGVVNPTLPRSVSAIAGILDVQGVEYRLALAVTGRSASGSSVSSVVVSGPGIAASPLTSGCPWATENCIQRVVSFGPVKPTPGSTYVFSVAFADSTTQTLSATLKDLAVGYPNPASPAPGAVVSTSTPRFTWTAPSSGCVSSYVVLVSDSVGRAWSSGSLAPSTRSIQYNFNGRARLPALTDGSYTWSLFAFDCTGPSASETRNSARVTGIPFTVSGAGGSYRIRGAVSGLASAGLVLATAGAPPLTVPAGATSFAFANMLPSGTAYSVTVLQQPAGQTCSVADGSGVVAGADVDDVQVTCTSAFPLSGFDAASGRTAVFLIWFTPGVPSTSQVLWGPTPALGNESGVNTALVTDHNITIGGLAPNHVYYFQAVSVDALGRRAASPVMFKATQQ